ncbi:MAG TPA: cbb3-type cytochrome c oxidase subunit I [Candidatus Tectomicrobia bacterium]|nr:cbb3-type cytochrome c oxidase subunit I [Candidatus Tectomicrobia bacterium]
MPVPTRWFLKAALIYFIAALILGVVLAAPGVLALPPEVGVLGPVYFHLFMLGWVAQLIFGVVYWMFPRYTREKPRGSETLALATFGLLNAGLILRTLGEPINSLQPGRVWGWLVALSAVLQWLAGMAFVLNTWARVKEK